MVFYMQYFPDFLSDEQTTYLTNFFESFEWNWVRETFNIFGRQLPVPRKLIWFGNRGLNYRYTGLDHKGDGWPDTLLRLKGLVEKQTATEFNFLLVNKYANGLDYMGWHKDDEKDSAETIASVSLGAERKFRIKSGDLVHDLILEDGSLLVFDGRLDHALPKTKKKQEARINLTFRTILN